MKLFSATLALMLGLSFTLEAQKAPAKPAPKAHAEAAPDPEARRRRPKGPKIKLDLNTASKEALLRLPGMDPAQAAKIIAGRPYLTKTNLVTRNIMPVGLFESIRHLITARQPAARK